MTLGLPIPTLFAFLLVLARVSGMVAFLPLAGFRAAPELVRMVLVVALTIALFPVWPILPDVIPSMGQLVAWAFLEAGFGLMAGLSVAFLTEGFQLAAHIVGLQAGYGYSMTVDPTSQADAGVLQVLTSLMSGLLFFSAGADRELIRVLAASFERYPAGTWHLTAVHLDGIVHLGSTMLITGLRLALPVVAILLLIDVALALLGRMQQQLQLLSLAFPLKMLAALAILTALAPTMARVFEADSSRMIGGLWRQLQP